MKYNKGIIYDLSSVTVNAVFVRKGEDLDEDKWFFILKTFCYYIANFKLDRFNSSAITKFNILGLEEENKYNRFCRFRDPYGILYDVEVRKSELFTYILNK